MAAGDRRHVGARRDRTRVVALAALLLSLLLTLSCGGTGGSTAVSSSTSLAPDIDATLPPETGEPTTGGTLEVAVARGISDWNLLTAPLPTSGRWIASAVYEPLMRMSETGVPEPWLAESAVANETGTSWTITLRPGIAFSDGGPLTAAAVKTNLDARADSPLWESAMSPVGLVTAVDDRTVEVAMNRPWFGFDAFLSGPGGWQAAASTLLDGDGQVVLDEVEQPVGTGPFRVAALGEGEAPAPDGAVTLLRSDAYWGGPAPLDGVDIRVVPDARARADALASGRVDLIMTSDPNGLVRFLDRDGFIQIEDLGATESVVELNTADGPFEDAELRRAAVLATDAGPIAELFTDGLGSPATGPWTEDQGWFDPDTGVPEPDRAAAAQLVEAAGEDQRRVRLLVEPTVEEVQLAQAVASQWEAAGFEVQLDTRPTDELAAARSTGAFDAALVHTYAVGDPDHLVPMWHGSAAAVLGDPSTNTTRIESSELDDALDAVRSNADPAARRTAAADAVRAVNATDAVVWLDHDVWALVGAERVGGLGVPERFGFARIDAAPTWSDLWLQT
jgi:peptide/nickel transport system substrate-binding protein